MSHTIAPKLEPSGERPRNLHFTPNHQVILMHTNLRITDLNSFSDKAFWVDQGFVNFNESLGNLVKMQWSLICITTKLSGDAAGSWTIL